MVKVAHIGLQKSASTFLQKNVFNNVLNYEFLDFLYCKNISRKIISEGNSFDFERIRWPDKNFIFSYEALAGDVFTGEGINSLQTAQILKSMGFEKIIFISRKDKSKWIKSIHNHYIRMGGCLNFKAFCKNPSNSSQRKVWFPEVMEYFPQLLKGYEECFGKNNVLHLYSEEIYFEQNVAMEKLGAFLESPVQFDDKKVNQSMPNWMISVLLFTNNFTSSRYNPSTFLSIIPSGYVKKILSIFSKRKFNKFD